MKIALVQMNSTDSVEENLESASRFIRSAATSKPDAIFLPELFSQFGATPQQVSALAEPIPSGDLYQAISRLAIETQCCIHAGSVPELADGKVHNTSFVVDRGGRLIARYRKIHLFTALTEVGRYRESDTFSGGDDLALYDIGKARIGCAICFDLRFPELFAQLRRAGADVIALPSAFTSETGRDHWEPLLRARAIETQSYVVAAAQTGPYGTPTRYSWGRSLVVDPWGTICAQADDRPGVLTATLDLEMVRRLRERMPIETIRDQRGGLAHV